MPTRVLQGLIQAVVIPLLLAGCATPRLSTTFCPGDPAEPAHLTEALADAAGFFSRAGIDVLPVPRAQGADAAHLPTPQADFATMTMRQVLRAQAGGDAWKFVVIYTRLPIPIPGQDQPDLVGLAVQERVLQQNPEKVARMTAAFVSAYQFLADHTPTEALVGLPKSAHPDDTAYLAGLALIWDHLTVAGYVGDDTLREAIGQAKAAGLLPAESAITPGDVADFGPLQQSWRTD